VITAKRTEPDAAGFQPPLPRGPGTDRTPHRTRRLALLTGIPLLALLLAGGVLASTLHPTAHAQPHPGASVLAASRSHTATTETAGTQGGKPGGDPHAPPTADPGQKPLPAGYHVLGRVDLERYCQQFNGRHAQLRYPNAWGWRCGGSARLDGQQPGDYTVIVNDACAQQYGSSARAHYGNYEDPNSWFCLTP
jgi:hypothetical protein